MAFDWLPKQETLARAANAALITSLASSRNWIVTGLSLGVPGSGLSPTISNGSAWIDGYVAELDSETIAVTDDTTSTVYLGLTVDGSDNVTGIALSLTIPSSGYYVTLGTVTAVAGDITAVGTTGRSPEIQSEPIPTDADEIAYDNATSGLTATDVQEAVDELAARPLGGGWDGVEIRGTDLSKNNTTFESLVSFAAEANKTYAIRVQYMVVNGNGGNKLQITVPAGGSADFSISVPRSDASFNGTTIQGFVDIAAASSQNLGGTTGTRQMVTITGIITIVGTAGTVDVQVAQQSASATSIFKSGAILEYKDIT
jgi:hypothetical protein